MTSIFKAGRLCYAIIFCHNILVSNLKNIVGVLVRQKDKKNSEKSFFVRWKRNYLALKVITLSDLSAKIGDVLNPICKECILESHCVSVHS